jgi:hypothetical protein
MFLILLPLAACIIITLMGKITSTLAAKIGYILISSYAFSNGLSTILFIAPYRKHVYEQVVHPWLKFVIRKRGVGVKTREVPSSSVKSA